MVLLRMKVRVPDGCTAATADQNFWSNFGRQRAVPDAHGDLVEADTGGGGGSVDHHRRGLIGGLRFSGVLLYGRHRAIVVVTIDGAARQWSLRSSTNDGRGSGSFEFSPDRVQHAGHSVRLIVRQPDDGEHGPGHQTAAAHQR